MALQGLAWEVNLVPADQGHVLFGGPGVKLGLLIARAVRTGLVLVTASFQQWGTRAGRCVYCSRSLLQLRADTWLMVGATLQAFG